MSTKPFKQYDWKKNAKKRDDIIFGGERVELTPERKKNILESVQNFAAACKATGISAIIGLNFNDNSGDAEGLTALIGSKEELNEIFGRMQDMAKNGTFEKLNEN